jgi:photosystem II stability/assembly factor-like uncharacterized protein
MRHSSILNAAIVAIVVLCATTSLAKSVVHSNQVDIRSFELHNLLPKLQVVGVTNTGRIIAAGDSGSILMKDNDSSPWVTKTIAPGWHFFDIATSHDHQTIWLGARSSDRKSGKLFVSRNGGDNWNSFLQSLNFSPLAVATTKDASEVWVGGTGGKVVHASTTSSEFDVAMNQYGSQARTELYVPGLSMRKTGISATSMTILTTLTLFYLSNQPRSYSL